MPTTETPKPGFSRWVIGAICALAGAVLALAVALPIMTGQRDELQSQLDEIAAEQERLAVEAEQRADTLPRAFKGCSTPDGITLEDDNLTLTFDHRGEDDFSGATLSDITCVFDLLEMPARITTHMSQTTSLDGRQSAEWDDLEIQWSYHPDRGMDGVILLKDAQ